MIETYNNTVEAVDNATNDEKTPVVAIRGIADVHHNRLYNPDESRENPNGWTDQAIDRVHVGDWRNVEYHDDHYGADEPGADVGHPR